MSSLTNQTVDTMRWPSPGFYWWRTDRLNPLTKEREWEAWEIVVIGTTAIRGFHWQEKKTRMEKLYVSHPFRFEVKPIPAPLDSI